MDKYFSEVIITAGQEIVMVLDRHSFAIFVRFISLAHDFSGLHLSASKLCSLRNKFDG